MQHDGSNAPLSEPVIIQEVLVTGMDADIATGLVRFTGWSHIPAMGGESEERRIVVRFVMTDWNARDCCKRVHKALFGEH